MAEDKKRPFEESLPLPKERGSEDVKNPAAELIRKKVEKVYIKEPSLGIEAKTSENIEQNKLSAHQKFANELQESGKSSRQIKKDWEQYYSGLSDLQKHQIWQEYNEAKSKQSNNPTEGPFLSPTGLHFEKTPFKTPEALTKPAQKLRERVFKTTADLRAYSLGAVDNRKKLRPMQHFRSILFGLGVGCLAVFIFMFGFFNERFIAPFIQPSRNLASTIVIDQEGSISKNPEIIIPKINVQIPVVYDVKTINEEEIQKGLEGGVVHYADTALPGQLGNGVIVGHSSNNIFNSGKYKFAFVLLSRLENGDTFYINHEGTRFTYEVYKKVIVNPTDVSVLAPTPDASVTLITCDPPGTSTNRLVVQARQISPSQNTASKPSTNDIATKTPVIPSNAPSLWSRVSSWIF